MATEREIVFRVRVKDFEKLFSNLDELEKDISRVNTALKQTDNAQNIGALTTELAALKAQQKQVNTEIRVQTKLFQGLEEAEGSFNRLKAEADFLKNALKGLGKDTNLDDFQKRLEELLPSTKQLNLETLDLEQTQRALATRIVDNQVAMKEFNKSISANAQVVEFAEGSYKKLQQQTGTLSKELRLLGDDLPEGELRQLQKRLEEIEPRLKKYELSTKDLSQTKNILSRQINENNTDLADFNRALSASDELVGEYSRGIINAFGKLGLTDNLEKGLKSLNDEKVKLQKQLNELLVSYNKLDNKGGKAANDIRGEIVKLNGTLDDTDKKIDEVNRSLSKSAAQQQRAFSQIQGTLKAGIGLFAAQAGASGLGDIVSELKELSDAEADAAKTTNLTVEEIRELNQELKKIDTRTSQVELLNLAAAGGKLGQSKEDLFGFVEAADKLKVALGEDLGGDDAIKEIAKLTEIFGITDDFPINEALLKTGSLINSLGAAGSANEKFLVGFLQRTAGTAKQVGVTIDQLASVGAVLDEAGINQEAGASAYKALVLSLAKDQERYTEIVAESGKVTKEVFIDLLKNDANEALNVLLDSIQSSKDGFDSLADTAEKSGITAQESGSIVTALSQNVDKLRNSQKLASEEFVKGTSVTEEFNKKNQNFAAIVEKTKKELIAIFSESEFIESAEDAAEVVLVLAQNVGGLAKILIENKEAVATVVGAYGLYRAILLAVATQQRLNIIQTKALGVANASHAISTNAVRVAYFALTGQMAAARVASTALKASLATNPFTAILLGLTIVVPLLVAYSKNSEKIVIANEKLRGSNRSLNEQTTERINKIEQERTAANTLLEAIKKNIDNREISKRLITEFNTKYGSYLGSLDSEKVSLKQLETLQDNLNKKLLEKQLIIGFEEEINEILKKQTEAAKNQIQAEKDLAEIRNQQKELTLSPSQIEVQDDLLVNVSAVSQDIVNGTEAAVKEVENDYKKLAEAVGVEFNNILNAISGTTVTAGKETRNELDLLKDKLKDLKKDLANATGDKKIEIQSNIDKVQKQIENFGNGFDDATKKVKRTVGVIKEEISDLQKDIERATTNSEVLEIEAQIKIKESELKGILDPKSNESVKGSINAINKEINDLNEDLKEAADTAARDEIRVKIKVEENALKEIENENKEKQIVLPVRIETLDKEINDLKEKLKGASKQEKFQILGEIKLKQEEKEKLKQELTDLQDFEINIKIKANEQDLGKLEDRLKSIGVEEQEVIRKITDVENQIDLGTTQSNVEGTVPEGFNLTFAKQQLQEYQDQLERLQAEENKITVEIDTIGEENIELEKELSEKAQKEITDSRLSEEQKRQAKAQELREDAFKLLENEAQKEIIQAQNLRQQKLNELSQALANEEITQDQYNQQLEQLEQDHQDRLAQIRLDELNGKSSFVKDASVEYLQLVKERNDAEYQEHKKNEDRKIEYSQKAKDLEKSIQVARLQTIGAFVSGAKQFLSQDEQNRKKNADLIKSLAVGEIAVNLAIELSSIARAAAKDTAATGLIAGAFVTPLAALKSTAAIIKAAFATAQVLNQKFKKGGVINGKTVVGQTTDNGYIDSQGVAHGQRHKDDEKGPGGIGIMVGGQKYEIEDGEMIVENNGEILILNRNVGTDATLRQKVWNIRDNINLTPQDKKKQLSQINEENGGISFIGEQAQKSNMYSFSVQNRPGSIGIPSVSVKIPSIEAILGTPTPIPYGIITKTIETQTSNKQVIESRKTTNNKIDTMTKEIRESMEIMHSDMMDATQAINKRIDRIEVNLSVSGLAEKHNSLKVNSRKGRI